MALLRPDDQARLDYYRRVMDRLLLVGDSLHQRGLAGLSDAAPWAAGVDLGPNTADGAGRDGGLAARHGSLGAARPFPRRWPELAQAIRHAWTRYTRVDGRNIRLTRGASRNLPFLPGIAMNVQSFRADEATAIGELVHESLHDPGFGVLGTGIGHHHMKDLVPTILPPDDPSGDAFTQYVDFLCAARLPGGRPLWWAILDDAGPRPDPIEPVFETRREVSAGAVAIYLVTHAVIVAVCLLFFAIQTGRWSPRGPGVPIVEAIAAASLVLIPVTPVLGVWLVRRDRTLGRAVPWTGLLDLALSLLHIAALLPGYL